MAFTGRIGVGDNLFLFLNIYLFLGRGEGREKERERNLNMRDKYRSIASYMHPDQGQIPQSRHVA